MYSNWTHCGEEYRQSYYWCVFRCTIELAISSNFLFARIVDYKSRRDHKTISSMFKTVILLAALIYSQMNRRHIGNQSRRFSTICWKKPRYWRALTGRRKREAFEKWLGVQLKPTRRVARIYGCGGVFNLEETAVHFAAFDFMNSSWRSRRCYWFRRSFPSIGSLNSAMDA